MGRRVATPNEQVKGPAAVDMQQPHDLTLVTTHSLISKELTRFERQIKELQDELEGIKLSAIDDVEDRLKAMLGKANLMAKLPLLLDELERMRTKSKVKSDDIKGNKSLSPLEDGTLELPEE